MNSSDVGSALFKSEGFIIHEGVQLSLWSLSALFGVAPSQYIDPKRKSSSSIVVNSTLRSIASIKPNSEGVLGGDDRVNLVYRLINSISYFVSLQGLLTEGERGIHTLWVVYRTKETNSYSAYAIAPGTKPSLAWRLVESSAIPLPAENDPSDDIMEASEILNTALSLLMIEVDVIKYEYVGLRNMRGLGDDIKSMEMKLFAPMDDLPTAHYVLKSCMTLALSSCVSENVKELKHNVRKGFSEIGLKLETAEHQEQKQVVSFFALISNISYFAYLCVCIFALRYYQILKMDYCTGFNTRHVTNRISTRDKRGVCS